MDESLQLSGLPHDLMGFDTCEPAKCEDFVTNCVQCVCMPLTSFINICKFVPSPDILPCFEFRVFYYIDCIQCAAGSYVDKSGACSMCEDSINNCHSCVMNKDSLQCTTCVYGYTLNSTNSTHCISCRNLIPNCSLCAYSKTADRYECTLCMTGYITGASNGHCQPCGNAFSNCRECTMASSLAECTVCNAGYGLVTYNVSSTKKDQCKLCHSIVPGCAVCTFETEDQAICLACSDGLTMVQKNTCTNCSTIDPYCTNCTTGPKAECLKCMFGMDVFDGECHSCMFISGGCTACTYNPLSCTECLPGFYLDDTGSSATCILCSTVVSKCHECLVDSTTSKVRCISCKNGYYITSNNQCVTRTRTFAGCVESNAESCIVCKNGYALLNGNCILCRSHILGCTKCAVDADSNAKCLSCSLGYFIRNNKCELCSSVIENCRTCTPMTGVSSTDKVTCTDCDITYYLNKIANNCTLLIPNCAYFFEEKESIQCRTCLPHYRLIIGEKGNAQCTFISAENTRVWLSIGTIIIIFVGFMVAILLELHFKSLDHTRIITVPSKTSDSLQEEKRLQG